MGCGASKNDVIKSASSGADGPHDKKSDHKNSKDSLNSSVLSEGSTIPASEMYQNGNNNGISGGGPLNNKGLKTLPPLAPLKPVRSTKVGFKDENDDGNTSKIERPEPIAFEVPAADEDKSSLIKKHPPRRLRQLEENPPEIPNLTQQDIEDKVALANERRKQVLTLRVASARQKSARNGRVRRPALESEQYSMAEYVNEIDGGRAIGSVGGDFM